MLNWVGINILLLFLFIPISKLGIDQLYVTAISSTIFANAFLKFFSDAFKLHPWSIKYWMFGIAFNVVAMFALQIFPIFPVDSKITMSIDILTRVISAVIVLGLSTWIDKLLRDLYTN